MTRMRSAALIVAGVLGLLACVESALAQQTPEELYNNLPLELTGAKATSLGGAAVGSAGDNSTAWWNPAGNAELKDFTVVGVNATAMTGSIQELRNTFNLVTATDFADLGQADLDRLLAAGTTRIRAGAVPAVFVNTGHLGGGHKNGLGLFMVGAAYADVPVVATDTTVGGQRIATLDVQGGALAMVEYGASYSRRVGTVDLGLAVKAIEGLYYGVGGSITLTDNDLSDGFDVTDPADTTVTDVQVPTLPYGRGITWGVDVGMLRHTSESTQLGLVIRNINFPTLPLADANGVVRRTLTLQPRVDFGIRKQLDDHVAVALDLHNVLFANGGGPSLHMGFDVRAFGSGYVRFGVNKGTPSLGLGFHLSNLYIDSAVGMGDRTYATLGAHMSF